MPDFEFDHFVDQVKSTTATKLGDLNQKIEDAIANTSDVGAALSEMYKSAKVAQTWKRRSKKSLLPKRSMQPCSKALEVST